MYRKYQKAVGIVTALLLCILCLPILGCKATGKTTTYEIDCVLNGNTLTATERVSFFNDTDNAFKELKFNLYGNAFRDEAKFRPISAQYEYKAYFNGISHGDMIINKVYGETDLEFSVGGEDYNILTVTLPEEVYPNECAEITIEYTLNLANVIARTGVNKKTINLGNFYPILCGITDGAFYECVYYSSGDPFYSDVADYTVTLEYEKDFIVASSGVVISHEEKEAVYKTKYQIDNARSFAMVLSKDFQSVKESVGGVEVTYYYYEDETPDKSLKTAVDSIKFFSEKFGAYPYSTYSVVQTAFVQGGMEFTALTFISDAEKDNAYLEVIVHETAHQWWETAVGNNEIEYGFLDEGLCEYSVITFYENHPDYGMKREDMVEQATKSVKAYYTVYDKLFKEVNTKMIRNLKDFTSEYEYVNVAYLMPCVMYDGLRNTIGEEKFFDGLKKYYKDYKFKNATPDDLIASFIKAGADAEGYLRSFFDGKAII